MMQLYHSELQLLQVTLGRGEDMAGTTIRWEQISQRFERAQRAAAALRH
jgi:hypothetical protein